MINHAHNRGNADSAKFKLSSSETHKTLNTISTPHKPTDISVNSFIYQISPSIHLRSTKIQIMMKTVKSICQQSITKWRYE